MLIVVSQRVTYDAPRKTYRDALDQRYIPYFERFNILPLPFSNFSTRFEDYFKTFPIQGIILTGGEDIHSYLYGERQRYTIDSWPQRDTTEINLIAHGIKNNLPILGICRGIQMLNVYFHGKLIQDIPQQLPHAQDHMNTAHEVRLLEERVERYLETKIFPVNSYHHQAITHETLAPELHAFACTGEVIEGVYHPHYKIAGIQWHPEREGSTPAIDAKLMNAFVHGELFWEQH